MGKLGNVLGMIGQGAGIVGTAAGILGIGEKRQDRRQIEQQERLQELQIKGNKEMSEFEKNQQLDMWNKTNYGAQVDHIKEAGLNPAMLYGMGGAGGATTGGGPGQGITGGHAATGVQGQGMAIETAMAAAQLGLMQAQTQKTKAEAEKISGTDTTESQTRTTNITQGTENLKAQNEILKVQVNKELAELGIVANEGYISANTKEARIKQIVEGAIGEALRNELTEAQTKGEIKGIEVKNATIKKMANDTVQKFIDLDLTREQQKINLRQTAIQELKTTIEANYPGMWSVVGKEMERFFDGIAEAIGETRELRKPKVQNR